MNNNERFFTLIQLCHLVPVNSVRPNSPDLIKLFVATTIDFVTLF